MNVLVQSVRIQTGLPSFSNTRTLTIDRAIQYALQSVYKDRNLQRSVANGPLYFAVLVHLPHLIDSDEFVFESEDDQMKFLQAVTDHLMPPIAIRRFSPSTGMDHENCDRQHACC